MRHKYLECVPLLMSEKEFWQRYFRAKTRAGAPPVLPAATAGASVAAATGASATATVGVDAEGGLAVSESAPLRGATKPLDPAGIGIGMLDKGKPGMIGLGKGPLDNGKGNLD